MNYGSVCSGIEAASVAWESLGWEAQWYSEIDHFPSAVLKHRFPTVPNLGDMTLIHETKEFQDATIDLLVGGTPCQSFSVAGLRKGLADPRGNLMLTFLSLAERKKPRWIVWENVPGVLSSNGGRDFGTFLTALGDIGYGFAYRILDAQYFGVAQRRRRVFVVAYLGDWRPAAALLFESESLSGDSKKSREKRKATSSDAQGCSGGGSQPIAMAHGQANAEVTINDKSPTLSCVHESPIVTHAFKVREGSEVETGPTMAIRRLTPKECERLQGFPYDWTLIPYRNKSSDQCPDGPGYKACGNSMAVPVMRWIGQRIQMVEELLNELKDGRMA